ncbi:hypothetical protein [Leifsonia sp. NPDC058230]|uniref:hypothetical protein n=1 Tax=Leifsonia sp. NPDC058230 TaxID=3346391 RepID=UPI0036DD3C2E
MRSINGTSPLYVKNVGRGTTTSTAVGCAILALSGPLLILFASVRAGGLLGVVGGIVLSVLAIPFSLWVWRGMRRQAARIRRLDELGVEAAAEIVGVTPATVGEAAGVALDVRLTAAGIEPYEATIRCTEDDRLRVGVTLPATVEPQSKEFMLHSAAVRGEKIALQ